jgi:CDP-4-dehydro-6-deoxyglucose reductase
MPVSGFKVTITQSGRRFTANAGESLLDAALRQGIQIPFSCRTGRCSTCKCRVTSGRTAARKDETGLSKEQCEQGWKLACVRAAESDVELDIEDLGDIPIPKVQTLPCRIHELSLLAPDVILVRLRLPPSAVFVCLAGQYIDIMGPDALRRSYSVADTQPGLLELHVRRVDGGAMSAYWFERAKVNDLLRLHGPLGTFFLRQLDDLDLIFLATGTGIAPVYHMLKALAALPADRHPRSTTVYWGARVPVDLYLPLAAGGSSSVRYVPVLSRAPADWTGERGYVQQVLLSHRQDYSRAAVYACGSDTMIRSAQEALVAAGLPQKNFYSDAFVCSSTVS